MRRLAAIAILLVVLMTVGCTESSTRAMVVVPKRGQVITPEVRMLQRAGLLITIPTSWGSDSFSGIGATIKSPLAGTEVPVGTVVTIEMEGIVGLPSTPRGHHVVPNVVGSTLLEATKRIQAAGLPWGASASPLPPTRTYNVYASYCITDQHPNAGTIVSSFPSNRVWLVHLQADPCPRAPHRPLPRA